MNKLLFSSLLFVLISFIGNSQTIRASLPIGFNASQIDGDAIAGYHKFGFYGGVGANLFIAGREDFEFGFEMIYHQTGSKSSNIEVNESGLNRKIAFQQLSIPIFVNYLHYEGGFVGLGFAVNRTLNTKWVDEDLITAITWDGPISDNQFKETDLTGFGQIGYAFNNNLRASLRFNYSIIPFGEQIPRESLFRLPRHNYISVRIETILTGLFK